MLFEVYRLKDAQIVTFAKPARREAVRSTCWTKSSSPSRST
jgi:hypothetical protein